MSDHLSGEVIGFRQWYVTPKLTLRAAHKRSQEWTPGENNAECHPNESTAIALNGVPLSEPKKACTDAPGHDCECGLYALHDPSDFWYGKRQLSNFYRQALGGTVETDPLVSGVVAAWGNIEVHHQGFRAQYARVVAIALPEGKRDAAVARAVAAEYGVPVVDAKRLTQIAGEFGSTVPVEMRPEKPEPKASEITITLQGSMAQFQKQLDAYERALLGTSKKKAKGTSLPKRTPTYDYRWYISKHKGGLA